MLFNRQMKFCIIKQSRVKQIKFIIQNAAWGETNSINILRSTQFPFYLFQIMGDAALAMYNCII